jgi:signal transduction histidine kinase
MVVPLTTRGRTIGAITMGAAGRAYDSADLELASEIARRAAVAIEHARLYHQSREAIRLHDEFLAVASHELYTPMTSLKLSLQMLARLGPGELTHPHGAALLHVLENQEQRLTRLIDDLLDVSRLETGRLALTRESVDLAEVARGVVRSMQRQLADAGCDVELRSDRPTMGHWDAARLGQVLSNLLSNAAKWGAGHPIEIAVQGEPRQASMTVSDHGSGIAPTDRSRIFERFTRAASAEHRGGLGLGLSISKGIVDAHGGTIRFETELGRGTTFIVELPYEAQVPDADHGRDRLH